MGSLPHRRRCLSSNTTNGWRKIKILFRKKHIKKILRRKKTQTRRRANQRRSYHVGRIYGIRSRWFDKSVAYIRITGKRTEKLGAITPEDAEKEGGYTIEEFKAEWEAINGPWNPNTEVDVYDFELAEDAYKGFSQK